MKSAVEIARTYGVAAWEVENCLDDYIKAHVDFPYKKNFWGEISIPDDVDVEPIIQPLLLKKLEKEQKLIENRLIEQEKKQEEVDRQEKARQQKEEFERKQREKQHHLRIESLKARNASGYYEYKVVSLADIGGIFKKNSGRVDTETMTQILNDLGIDGWHLVTAYSNELGKNALSGGVGGALLGVNSTVDENILVFERFVKI